MATSEAALPYLKASLDILSTLEREIRSADVLMGVSGTARHRAAECLNFRMTELRAHINRIEFSERSTKLEVKLGVAGLRSASVNAAPTNQPTGLRGKVERLEKEKDDLWKELQATRW